MRKVAQGLDLEMLIILNQSRVSYPRRSGLVGKSNMLKIHLSWIKDPKTLGLNCYGGVSHDVR